MDNNLITKAKNYFILGRMAEKINMLAESAANYFKALSAVNDCMLGKFGLKPRDYVERFNMLKKNIPLFYEITDKLFITYRRTYSEDLSREEAANLRNNVMEAFKNAGINPPTDKEVEEYTKKLLK